LNFFGKIENEKSWLMIYLLVRVLYYYINLFTVHNLKLDLRGRVGKIYRYIGMYVCIVIGAGYFSKV
jgi:hypothetical protein